MMAKVTTMNHCGQNTVVQDKQGFPSSQYTNLGKSGSILAVGISEWTAIPLFISCVYVYADIQSWWLTCFAPTLF